MNISYCSEIIYDSLNIAFLSTTHKRQWSNSQSGAHVAEVAQSLILKIPGWPPFNDTVAAVITAKWQLQHGFQIVTR